MPRINEELCLGLMTNCAFSSDELYADIEKSSTFFRYNSEELYVEF